MKLKLPKNLIRQLLISTSITFVLGISALNLFISFIPKEVVAAPNPIEKELAFWREMVKQNPTYRDAYLYLSELEKRMGNIEASIIAREEARKLDPNR